MIFCVPQPKERLLQLWVVCTVGMLRDVYHNNAMLMRRNVWKDKLLSEGVNAYRAKTGRPLREWDVGKLGHFAGYHCSWCYPPKGIRTKLLSAQKHDKPRWGDYPEKTDLKYIANLIQTNQLTANTRKTIGENNGRKNNKIHGVTKRTPP